MKTKFYLDKRTKGSILSTDEKREYPIKIAINHRGSSAYIATGISIDPEHWQSKPGAGMVVGTATASRLNIALSEKKISIDKALEKLRMSGELHGLSATEIKDKVEKRLRLLSDGLDGEEIPVIVCAKEYLHSKKRRGTIRVYKATIDKLNAYSDFSETMTFRSITPSWLAGFEAFLAVTMPSANSRAIFLRNIRRLFNYAIGENYTAAPYPFKRFKIKYEPTKDRSLTKEELLSLYNAPCGIAAQRAKDLFFLSFYLCGMNLEDILSIRKKDIKGGRIEIRRIKTGQPLSIRIEPEAYIIINKYKDNAGERLLNIGIGVNYVNLMHRLNDQLKNIGRVYNRHTKMWEGESVIADLTFYCARYSWATISAELDNPERSTGAGMGHSTSKSVTSIYTRVDMKKKVDIANRKVIDFVFQK